MEIPPVRSALVTGAAGFIGSHLCEALLARGTAVTGVDAMTSSYAPAQKELNLAGALAHERFRFHPLDLAEAPIEPLLYGVDTVFHLAARPGVRDSWADFDAYVRANVCATKRLLDACVGRPVRVVYASSSSVYGDAPALPVTEGAALHPVSPYGATKVTAEAVAGAYWRSHGVEVVGLRYFTVYGPRQRPDMAIARFIAMGERGEEIPVFGDGRQLRDFTYVGDIVAGTLLAAERGRPGAVYNIASGDPHPLVDVLGHLRAVLEHPLALRFAPAQVGDVRDTWGNIALAHRELGYMPRVGLDEGLAAQVAETERRRETLATGLALS